MFVSFSLFVVCQDFISSNAEDALIPDFYEDTPDELPATPPPTAVVAGGNDFLFYLFAIYFTL